MSERTKRLPGLSGAFFEVGEPEDHALGRSRGGFGTKINLLVDGNGLPLAVSLKPGEAHEINSLESLLESVKITQPRGAPKRHPDALAGDKGYSAAWVRNYLASYGIEDVIPTKDNEERNPGFDKEKYRMRNIVERAIGWLKQSRRIAMRFEKLATRFLGMIHLEIIMTYLGELPDTT